MKTSSIAVKRSRSISQSDSIVRQTNKRSFLSDTTTNNIHIFNDIELAYRFVLKERIQVIYHNQTLCNKIVLGKSVECKFVTVHSINYRRSDHRMGYVRLNKALTEVQP